MRSVCEDRKRRRAAAFVGADQLSHGIAASWQGPPCWRAPLVLGAKPRPRTGEGLAERPALRPCRDRLLELCLRHGALAPLEVVAGGVGDVAERGHEGCASFS